jgi:hypothetical protein
MNNQAASPIFRDSFQAMIRQRAGSENRFGSPVLLSKREMGLAVFLWRGFLCLQLRSPRSPLKIAPPD